MGTGAASSQYEVLRRIARGGMGEVFLARQRGIEGFAKEVVIKQIHSNLADDPGFVRMFLQEARIAALLDHPNIVQIFELGRRGKNYFIVMEYVEGPSLSRLLRAVDGPLPLPLAVQVANGVALGLQFAHGKSGADGVPLNLVHRDVSPPNILLSNAGNVKITDFGIAKVRWSVIQTEAGTVKGKYYYISPEQARGEEVDWRSDIYSLGLVLYEMTTGQRAYVSETDTEVLRAAASGAITPPAALVPSYPRDLERVVLRALEVRPEDRYSDCGELQEDLTALLVDRKQVLSPSRLGQYVVEAMQRTVEVPALRDPDTDVNEDAAPTRVDNLSEVQTIILSRVEDRTEEDDEDDEPTTAEAPTLHYEETQQLPAQREEPTGITATALHRPGYPGEDDEPTRLDTRLPPLESGDELPTSVDGSFGKEDPTDIHVRGLPVRMLIVALALLAVAAALVTWLALAPEPETVAIEPDRGGVVVAASPDTLPPPDVARPADVTAADVASPDVVRRAVDAAVRATPLRPRRPRRRPLAVSRPQATLRLSTDPTAQVFLGRRSLGRTPLKVEVPARPLKLRFRNRALGLDTSRELHPKGTSLAARFLFRKGKIIFALPVGLRVKLDGKALGRTPLAPAVVFEGRHVLEVGEGGNRRRTVEVPAGRSVRLGP